MPVRKHLQWKTYHALKDARDRNVIQTAYLRSTRVVFSPAPLPLFFLLRLTDGE